MLSIGPLYRVSAVDADDSFVLSLLLTANFFCIVCALLSFLSELRVFMLFLEAG